MFSNEERKFEIREKCSFHACFWRWQVLIIFEDLSKNVFKHVLTDEVQICEELLFFFVTTNCHHTTQPVKASAL